MGLHMLPCGGSVTTPDQFLGVDGHAHGYDGLYRTRLVIRADKRTAVFILGHPVETSGTPDDAAEARCRDLADSWGFGTACIVYLFPCRADSIKDLQRFEFGRFSRVQHIHITRAEVHWAMWTVPPGLVVAAWGEAGRHKGVGESTLRWFAGGGQFVGPFLQKPFPIYSLGATPEGDPAPPLHPAASDKPVPIILERRA